MSIYSAGYIGPATITKIGIGSISRLAGITLQAGEGYAQWLLESGGLLYVALYTSPGIVAKVNLATFARDSVLTLGATERELFGLAISGDYLYVSSYTDGKIIKINLATFTKDSTLTLTNGSPEVLVVYGGYLYVGHYTNPAKITKVDLASFTEDTILTLTGERYIESMIEEEGYLYAGMIRTPARISKVNLATFTLDSTLALSATYNRAESMAVSGTDLYVGLNTTKAEADPTPIIIKIDLGTFTEAAVLTKSYAGLSYPVWGLIVVGSNLYAGIYLNPGVVEQIRLSDFTIIDTLTLNVGETSFSRSFASYVAITTPEVTTDAATGVASGVATLNGTLDADGGEACDCGFEWGETDTYGNTTPTQSRENGQTFTQALAGLDPDTTYHFRAFATNSAGTGYGDDATFATDPVDPTISIPTVTTDEPSVAQEVATLEGTLVDNGGEDCSCYLEWGRTIYYGTTEEMGSKTTGETFSQQISGLIPNTEYHYRAYAVNSAGTGYGDDKKFITQQRPVVNYRPVENRAYALSRWEC